MVDKKIEEKVEKVIPEEKTEKEVEKIEEKTEKEVEKIEEKTEKEVEKIEEKVIPEEKTERKFGRQGQRGNNRRTFDPKVQRENILLAWEPKTKLGQEVKQKKIQDLDEILDKNQKILEPEIIDSLMEIQSDLISIGQSKGKFGGGKRRAWRQTQRKTKEGNVPTFSTMAVVGDGNGHVGLGTGRAKETLPARDKAIRKAKLNIMKVARGCAAFDCACSEKHTIPFKVEGKAGSVRVILIPAPQGTGLVVGNELKKVLKLAGIKDVYSQTFGKKRTTFNLIKACIDALNKTTQR